MQFHLRKVERPGLQGQSGFDLHGPGRSEQVADGEIIVFGTVCREPLRRGLGKLPNESPASAYGIVERVERIGNFLHEECGRHHLPRSPHVDLCQRTDQADRTAAALRNRHVFLDGKESVGSFGLPECDRLFQGIHLYGRQIGHVVDAAVAVICPKDETVGLVLC